MKIRKVFALILSQVLCLFSISTVSLSAFADDAVDFEKVYVSAVVNGKNQNLPAIQNKEGNVFFSGKTLSDVTVYNNNTSDYLFEHDNVDLKHKYRSIKIDKSIKKAHLLSFGLGEPIIQKSVDLPDIIEFENEVYYPIAEMLPILNANATVSDNKLYIEDVPYSLSNIMPEFNISDYMFDIYGTETKILSGYSYLFNGLLDFELKKFVPIVGTRINKIETYEEIFTSYLAEDEAYFEAIGDEEHYELPMIKYLLDDDSERIDTVIEGMGAANDILKDYSGYDISTEDLKMIKSSAALGKQLDHAIKLYSFAAIYTDHVTDHYEMLDAIYDFEATRRKNKNKIIVVNEESFAGADKIYKMYTEDQKKAIANYIGKQIENKVKDLIEDGIKDGISSELSLGHAFAWSKLAASVMKAYFIATDFYVYNVSRKCENLPYYNKLMERGASKFWAYNNAKDNISKDNIEKARLSAIFTLLSSRSMYQALCDSDKALENSGAIYQKKIDAINEALKKLYLAKNCCLTDSGEYIDERIKELKQSMADVSIVDTLNNIDSYEAYKDYFLDNYSLDDLVCLADVTQDGRAEMIIVTEGEQKGNPKFTASIQGLVYTINNGIVEKIYEKSGSASHAGGFFEWYLTQDGHLEDGIHSMWQGRGEQRFEEYYLTNSGERIDIDSIVLSDKTSPVTENGEVSNEAYQDYVNKINVKVEKSFLLYSSWSEASVLPQFIEMDPRIVFNIVEKDDAVESHFYGKKGVVSTESSGLNLRVEGNTTSDVITEIPKNSSLKILDSEILLSNTYNSDNNKWLLVDYNGMIGYVSENFIKYTDEKVELTNDELTAIAQLKYYEGLNAVAWEMSSCFEKNRDVVFNESEYYYTLLVGINTKEDWLNNVHTLFSKRYDDYYKYDEIINMNSDRGYPYYLEKENNWYENDLIHRKGALDVDLLYPDKHNIISLTISSINDNEVFFDGNVDWSKGKNAQTSMYSDYKDISGFSIVYEEGHWKCGRVER